MIGKIIKQKRLEAKMSQAALAKNVTSQTFISRLENNEVDVSAEILYKLSQKLKFSIDELYSEQKSHHLSYPCIDSLLNDIDNCLLTKDYFFLTRYKNNPLLEQNPNSKIMNGIISILHAFYVTNNLNYCENKLDELLDNNKNVIPELYFRLLIFSGYLNINKLPLKAKYCFEKAYKLNKKTKISVAANLFFYVYYCELLYNLKDYKLLKELSREALEFILNKKIFYYFEDISYYYLFSRKFNDPITSKKHPYIELHQFALWYSKFNEKMKYINLLKVYCSSLL